ncbi:hypothetical protein VNI00_000124 [Paramarasmius palmivorus]|uniref:Uncharacterized protein n=1 Tax=Paramarasmius palmivorus TaxID=297713 RepID=A0AAW0EC14_9AGAR
MSASQNEIQILQGLLHGSTDVDQAVARLTAPVLDALQDTDRSKEDTKSADDIIWGLWMAFAQMAKNTPASDGIAQEKLVDCLAAIKKLPPAMVTNNETGEREQYRNWGGRVWDDLPLFGPVIREEWNWFDPPETDPERDNERKEWVNLNAFVAHVTLAHVMDFELYAIWALRDAFEEDGFAKVPDDSESPSTTSSPLDAHIPAAAQWIFVTGTLIYHSERQWVPGPNEGDPARGGPLLPFSTQGFSRERWNFWKMGFATAAKDKRLGEDTKNISQAVYEKMEEIENSSR